MYGSESWPTKVQHEMKMNCTEMSTIRWMCRVKLNERKKSEELTRTLRIVTSRRQPAELTEVHLEKWSLTVCACACETNSTASSPP